MPLLAINVSDKLFRSIKELIEGNKHESFESFLEIAAFNQMALEKGATPGELIAGGHRRGEPGTNGSANHAPRPRPEIVASMISEGATQAPKRRSRQSVGKPAKIEKTSAPVDVADVFLPFRLEVVSHWPTSSGESGSVKPLKVAVGAKDDHIFGQVNRLFPMKLACRYIAWRTLLSPDSPGWPAYGVESKALAHHAAEVGSLLEQWDRSANRKRDEVLATGLPRMDNLASQDRFLTQFVARQTRSREIFPGAICQYRLADFYVGPAHSAEFYDADHIGLTEQGYKLALMKNPMIDSSGPTIAEALSAEEAEFLTRHVAEWVPCEREDMRIILQAIASGKTVPKDLSAEVRPKFPSQWSEAMLMTHVSGLIARLGDLKLIRRIWQGRNVNYELGDQKHVEILLKNQSPKEAQT